MLVGRHPIQRVVVVVGRLGKRTYIRDRSYTPQGPPGYSAVSGNIATVFGATGFLGRYVVAKLAKQGTQVVIPYRDEDEKRILKPMGDLGQIVSMEWDLRNDQQIAECVRHSDIVFNLVGRTYETKNFSYDAVHAAGAERIARITGECGVPRLVHVSHLNADLHSESAYLSSKAKGEGLVKKAFPMATIVRPGPMYGSEDQFLRSMATLPILWKLNHAQTKTRPVHVLDIAQALANMISLPPTPRTLSLPGPSTLTHSYLLELVSQLTYNPLSTAPVVPKKLALFLSNLAQKAWWPMVSPDEVLRRYIDDVDVDGTEDWQFVGVKPAEIEQHAISYLRHYRNGLNYNRPVVFPQRPAAEVE